MKSLTGEPNNFDSVLVGRISNKQVKSKERKNTIFIISNLNEDIRGYKAIITSVKVGKKIPSSFLKIPFIHSVKDFESLFNGDLVLLEMHSGTITIMFEKNSTHNSIFATSRCNSKCIMCPQPSKKDPPKSERINLELVKLIDKSTHAIGITGGEPTLGRNNLIRLLKECNKNMPQAQIQLLTNGILLKNMDYVEEIVNIGIDNLIFCIPIYADTDLEHDFIMQRKNSFQDTIQGLYNLEAFEQSIELRVVVFSHNFKRLPQIADFFYHNFPFVMHIAFMGIELEGLAKENRKKLWISPLDYIAFLEKAVLYLSQRDMEVSIYNEQLCLLPKSLWAFSCKSISDWKNIYIEECNSCKMRENCGGFFKSVISEHRKLINKKNCK